MLKTNYRTLELALEGIENEVKKTEPKAVKELTTEFVRLNTEATPFLTGNTRRNILVNTDYRIGKVVNTTPYSVRRYYENKTGKIKYFEYTWEKYEKEFEDKYASILDKNL